MTKMMMNICNYLGIEKLFNSPKDIKLLKKDIMDDLRAVIPGYKFDYYLKTYNNKLDFLMCLDGDGNEAGIDVHASGDNEVDLIFDKYVSTSDSAHIYMMHGINEKTAFPVRIVCPDILAGPEHNDVIHGQIVAIAGDSIHLSDAGDYSVIVSESHENEVAICGRIMEIGEYSFCFGETKTEYWVFGLETSIGTISVITLKDRVHEPAEGQFVELEGVLSFDVSVGLWEDTKRVSLDYVYDYAAFDIKGPVGSGLIPNYENARRVLKKCAEDNDFTRFARACAPEIAIYANDGDQVQIEVAEITKVLTDRLKEMGQVCSLSSIKSYPIKKLIGDDVVLIGDGTEIKAAISIWVDKFGYADELHFLDVKSLETADDINLRVTSILAKSMCECKPEILEKYLSEDCIYRSEDADRMRMGSWDILMWLRSISDRIDETNCYDYQIVPSREILRPDIDLPDTYKTEWCAIESQCGRLANVAFVRTDSRGLINYILLSRDGKYISLFEETENAGIYGDINVRELIEARYGTENALEKLRDDEALLVEDRDLYKWRKIDEFATDWISKQGFKKIDEELEEDCIGYAYTDGKDEYALYCFAYDENSKQEFNAEYCQRLYQYGLSINRTVRILFLWAVVKTDEDDNEILDIESSICHIEDDTLACEIKSAGGKNILVYHREDAPNDVVTRFIAAYNSQDLDIIRSLCGNDAAIVDKEGIYKYKRELYDQLRQLYKTYGKMRIAYVRTNDCVFEEMPYLDGYGYFDHRMDPQTGNIDRIEAEHMDYYLREIILSDEIPEDLEANDYPDLISFNCITGNKKGFSLLLRFSNNEVRNYPLIPDAQKEEIEDPDGIVDSHDPELLQFHEYIFTQKIFEHAGTPEDISRIAWKGNEDYIPIKPGIIFANGLCLSVAELYFNSTPYNEYGDMG